MARMNVLLSIGAAIFRVVVGSKNRIIASIAPRCRAQGLLVPLHNTNQRFIKQRISSLLPILFAGIAALWGTTAAAQSHTIYLSPQFLFKQADNNVLPYETTLAAAWADVQASGYCGGGYCYSYSNLMPVLPPAINGYLFDGIPYYQSFDITQCDDYNNCYLRGQGDIGTMPTCPNGGGAGNYSDQSDLNNGIDLLACALTIWDVQPSNKYCWTCIGNPILPATGQKLQMESDYAAGTGLNFIRTYRSNNGQFSSVLTEAIQIPLAAGTVQPGCYYGPWTAGAQGGFYCFPFISTYPYTNNGVAEYTWQTEDGRSIQFIGFTPQYADVDERLSQVTVNGASDLQIMREDDSIELYNATGSLIQKTLRGGATYTYTYSTSQTPVNIAPAPGLLLSQSDAFGHTLSWQYNSASQMTQMTDPAGGIYHYSYTNGNLTGVIYPDSSSKTYWYNESANTAGTNLPTALTGITDENGVRFATFQYNSSGLAVNTQHAGGVDSYTFTYSTYLYATSVGSNYSATVTDPLGTSHSYTFGFDSPSHNMDTGQTQPAASGSGTVTQSETYDANGNPATLTDYNGNITHYVYDLTRNLETSRTEAYGTAQARTITTQWNASWRQPSLITESNRTTGFTYDGLGNVLTKTITDTSVTPNVARTWTYTYDTYGRMLTADGPRTDVVDKTTYAYYTCTTGYQCGQIHTITDALGHVTTFNTYNAHGQPLTITDPNGVVTTLTYDARLRITSRQIGTETTGYSYYPTGVLKLVTLPDGSTITYAYDGAHRLTDITDGLGNHIHYSLDNLGNRTAENAYDPSNSLHRTHTRVFNALNELYQDINAAGTAAVTTTLAYDNDGNLTSSDAPLSRNTVNQYDALNRLTQITDPKSGITIVGYDANDNLMSVKDPRTLTTSYSHNGFGDVTQTVSPDTGTTLNTYDSGGNLKTATDARSALATYAYDALNRVTQVAYSDQTINFSYDVGTNGKGRLTGASDAHHSLSWSYDTHGRITGKGQTVGSVTKSVGYSYTNGDMTSLVTPSGQTVTYTYTNHHITAISVGSTTLLSAVTYDPFGPATAWTWGNSSTVTRAFDEDGNPHQIVTATVTNAYTVDNASRITAISDSGLSSDSFTFGYDLLDRVTSGTSTGKSRGYTYDANGNRLTTTGTTSSTETISTTNNRLNSTSGGLVRTYGYDAAGNTLSYTGDTFTFNQRGRMSSATVSAGETNYLYNALGQLMEKSGNGGTTLLVYDEAGHLLGEYTSSGALVQETIWMGDIPVATLRPNGSTACTSTVCIFYVHTDHLGSPRKVTQASSNTLAWRWDPDTFGSVAPNANPSGLGTFTYNLRFPGQYSLNETGLYYNYFRDYDPQVGRYIESDPIGLAGGSYSTYSYTADNPTNYLDPEGLAGRSTAPGYTYPTLPFGPNTPENAALGNLLTQGAENLTAWTLEGVTALDNYLYRELNPIESRTIPKPPRPSCGCTCTCRADANDNIPGNIKPGDRTFAFGTANASSCAQASKLAKRVATQNLGKQPKHVGCKCTS